jgi:hypothetical protein
MRKYGDRFEVLSTLYPEHRWDRMSFKYFENN